MSFIGSRLPDPIPQRAIQIEVTPSASAVQNARTQTKRTLSQRRSGNNQRLAQSSLQKRRFRHEEKITMSTKVIAAIIALAFPALGAGNSNRDNEYNLQVRSILHTAI